MIANYRQAVPIESEPIVKVDPNTLLLLHGEELTDSSSYQRELQNSGVTISTAQSKFGSSSLYFNGSSYLSLADVPFPNGSEDFTVDWWQYITGPQIQGSAVLSRSHISGRSYGLILGYWVTAKSGGSVYFSGDGTAWTILANGSMGTATYNAWQHFAIVRNGSSIMVFNNGKLTASVNKSDPIIDCSGDLFIGVYDYSPFYKFSGYIDELRISNVARWTENFTPPTEPYEC